MINLLPEDIKQVNTYGAKNRTLLRWVAAFFIGLLGLAGVILFGHYQLNLSIETAKQQVARSEERLQAQEIEATQAQTEAIDSSIKLALQVLEEKVLFSQLLQRIGSVMPEGTVLEGLTLEGVDGGIDLSAKTTSHQAATQVQVNIIDSSQDIFKAADIVSIACNSTTQGPYPCTVTLRALFKDNNPFLFVNQAEEPSNE